MEFIESYDAIKTPTGIHDQHKCNVTNIKFKMEEQKKEEKHKIWPSNQINNRSNVTHES